MLVICDKILLPHNNINAYIYVAAFSLIDNAATIKAKHKSLSLRSSKLL